MTRRSLILACLVVVWSTGCRTVSGESLIGVSSVRQELSRSLEIQFRRQGPRLETQALVDVKASLAGARDGESALAVVFDSREAVRQFVGRSGRVPPRLGIEVVRRDNVVVLYQPAPGRNRVGAVRSALRRAGSSG